MIGAQCTIAGWCKRESGHDGWCAPVGDSTMRPFPDQWMNEAMQLPVWPAPVGTMCCSCDRPIIKGERGLFMMCPDDASGWIVWHRLCFFGSMGIRHLAGDNEPGSVSG